jgi:hypothetical protein
MTLLLAHMKENLKICCSKNLFFISDRFPRKGGMSRDEISLELDKLDACEEEECEVELCDDDGWR